MPRSGLPTLPLRILPQPGCFLRWSRAGGSLDARGSLHVIERHARAYRHTWMLFVSGVFEPAFYLLSIGLGLGALIGSVTGPGGDLIPYRDFVAPGLLAVSSMNGVMNDSTLNIFVRLKFARLYDSLVVTPISTAQIALGEVGWALVRGTAYSSAFFLVMVGMGLVRSAWGLLDVPVTILIGFAFAALGMAGTTWMKSWQDTEYVILANIPLFLFSGTFYPLNLYPAPIRIGIEWTPLYQGVALLRDLTLGAVGPGLLWRAAYLVLLAAAALLLAGRRLGKLLLL